MTLNSPTINEMPEAKVLKFKIIKLSKYNNKKMTKLLTYIRQESYYERSLQDQSYGIIETFKQSRNNKKKANQDQAQMMNYRKTFGCQETCTSGQT